MRSLDSAAEHRCGAKAGGARSVPVVGMAKGNESEALRSFQLPVLACNPERRLHPGRSVIGIEYPPEFFFRKKIYDLASQFDGGWIRSPEKGSVRNALELLTDRRIDPRVIMAVHVCPNRRISVDVFTAAT